MKSKFDSLVQELCSEVDDLKSKLDEAKCREKYWHEQYQNLLQENLQHSQIMAENMLQVLLTPGVTKAFTTNPTKP